VFLLVALRLGATPAAALGQTTDWSTLLTAAKPAVVWIRCEVAGEPRPEAGQLFLPTGTSSLLWDIEEVLGGR